MASEQQQTIGDVLGEMLERGLAMSSGCHNCKFYMPDKRAEYAKENGHCRRYPPQLIWQTHDGIGGEWGQDYPYMAADDWCGEHQATSTSGDGKNE